MRLRAITLIGLSGNKHAADALVACALRHGDDIEEGLMIVYTLSVLDNGKPSLSALRYLHARHPQGAVKDAALASIALPA